MKNPGQQPALALSPDIQSALSPQGAAAVDIAQLAWLLFAGAGVIFALVIALAVLAAYGPDRTRARLATRRSVVGWGIVFPAVTLTALLAYTLHVAAAIKQGSASPRLRIEVVGEQWWWRVHYLDARGIVDFATANEIRIPVGVPVELVLKSADVIHSLWVPSLAGKMDMIPGRANRLGITAERAGTYRGQCAEYCGGPHAHMALYVIAEAPERHDAWLRAQRAPAQPDAAHGGRLFSERGCGVCHTVRGTPAVGTLGPDLTHVGSRVSIGAGILPNDAPSLERWISASHTTKPGNLMPRMDVHPAAELRAIADYLLSLR